VVSWRNVKKLLVLIVAPVLAIVGVALLVLPGPGLLLIGTSLALLATEFHWAKRLLEALRERLPGQKPPPTDKSKP
jgi:hypothetical protein